MKSNNIILTEDTAKELQSIRSRKIDLSDDPEIKNWEEVQIGKFYRPLKKQITIRIDADVLNWFQHASKKYQPLMNQACREFMQRHRLKKSLPNKK